MTDLRKYFGTFGVSLVLMVIASCADVDQKMITTSQSPQSTPCPQKCTTSSQITTEAELLDVGYQERVTKFLSNNRHSAHFMGRGDIRIAYEMFLQQKPNEEQDAIVIVSGRTESYVKYDELIYDLYRNGYAVFTYDHRGQGLSDRILPGADNHEKSYVERFDDYVEDLDTFIERIVRPEKPRRIFLLAQSMGGAIASLWAERHQKAVHALALSSPMHQPSLLGGYLGSRWACRTLVPLMGQFRPTAYAGDGPFNLTQEDIETNDYTHSVVRFNRFLGAFNKYEEARLGGPTWQWVHEACRGAMESVAKASEVQISVLLLQAGSDSVVEPEAQEEFCDNLASGGNQKCEGDGPVVIKGAKHEMFIESDEYRTPVLQHILNFFNHCCN